MPKLYIEKMKINWVLDPFPHAVIDDFLPHEIFKRLSQINAKNVKLKGLSERKALLSLINSLGIEDNKLSEWIDKVINNKTYRISLHEKLKSRAIKPQNPDWKVVKKSVRGNLII